MVIADFADRGVWPSIFLHLKPEQATVTGSQSALLAQQQQVLDLLGETFTVEPVRSKNRGIRFFRLRSKS